MNDFAITGNMFFSAVIGISALIIGVIFLMRTIFSKRTQDHLLQQKEANDNLKERNKYLTVNAFQWSNTFFMFALAASLSVVFMAFNWTQFDRQVIIPEGALTFEDDLMQEPPRTKEQPVKPPPLPPPVIEEVPEEEIDDEDFEFEDTLIDDETIITPPTPKATNKVVPTYVPPIPPERKVDNEVFAVVEQMPYLVNCKGFGSKEDIKRCSDSELAQFLYRHLKYPAIARENGIEGTCVIRFTIERNGRITDARIIRDIGAGCGNESLRVVNLMNEKGLEWMPGKQRNNPVRVQFTLPVKFKLSH